METQQPTRRLCSEIQLFDLCELDECPHKQGRFCTESGLLQRFEAIQEEDDSAQYLAEEHDEDDEGEEEAYGDEEFDDDQDY